MKKIFQRLFVVLVVFSMCLGYMPQTYGLDESSNTMTSSNGNTELTYPEFDYTKSFGEVSVHLKAVEGVLPAGTTATIEPVEFKEVKDILNQQVKGKEVVDALTYDINLFDADGNAIQPDGKVDITFSNVMLDKKVENATVYRIEEKTKDIDVLKQDVKTNDQTVEFTSDHFTYVSLAGYASQPESTSSTRSNVSTLANTNGIQNPTSITYEEKMTTQNGNEYALNVFNGEKWVVAYCFNAKQEWPVVNKNYRMIEDANAETMAYYSIANNMQVRQNVLKVIYNGYPYNASGLGSTYGLNAGQFRAVTQVAVWYYTDNMNTSELIDKSIYKMTHKPVVINGQVVNQQTGLVWTTNMTNCLYALLGYKQYGQTITPPSNFELDLFISQPNLYNQGTYADRPQNLLATRLGPDEIQEYINIPVEKKWEDGNNQDKIRPNSITVDLYIGNIPTGDTLVLNEDNGWKGEFKHLLKTNHGQVINYSVRERAVTGYTGSINKVGSTYQITNTHTPETTSVSGKKIWADNGNQQQLRPSTVDIVLFADGVQMETKTIRTNGTDQWTYSFTNLPKYKNGKIIKYTVKEENVPDGYISQVNGTTITNTLEENNTSIPVKKIWEDENNIEGFRPTEIRVELYVDNQPTGSVLVLNQKNKWSDTFENLKEYYYKDGQKVKFNYTVVEQDIRGYTATYKTGTDGITITNKHDVTYTKVSGKKVWDDRDNKEGKRPETITIKLLANGIVKQTKVINKNDTNPNDNNWEYEFTNLPTYENGQKVTYTVDEDSVKGYTKSIEGTTITNTETTKEVKFSKVDVGGKEVEGAVIEIHQNGKKVEGWTSTKATRTIQLKPGIYVFKEVTAPTGYVVVTEFQFVLGEDGSVAVLNSEDAKTKDNTITVTDRYEDQTIKVSKIDLGGNEIEGADIVIKDKDGNEVDKWTSEEGKSHDVTVQPGTYTFKETSAPKGYVAVTEFKFTVDHLGKVTVDDVKGNTIETENGKLVVTDKYQDQKVKISKVDLGGNEIEGANIVVKDDNGDEVDKWTSKENKTHEITVQPGTYTFEETNAPNGYKAVTTFEFTVDHLGNVTVDDAKGNTIKTENGKLVVTDKYEGQTVKVSKVDLGGNEIEGANIVIKDKDGNEVDKWTSEEGKSHDVTVQPGTYTFKETSAPKGYVAVTEFKFTVDHLGNVTVDDAKGNTIKTENGKLVVTDKYQDQKVKISKVDLGGNEIEGANIVVKDDNGDEVDKWTSKENKTHEITVQPGTYTFEETSAPKGYVAVTEFKFTVDHLGNVTVDDAKGNTIKTENGKLVVTDKYQDQKVKISKVDLGGNEIEGADIVIKDKDGNEVDKWTSEEGKLHDVTVQPGTYTFEETNAPNGYKAVTTFEFTVDHLGKVTVDDAKGNTIKTENGKLTVTDKYEGQTVKVSKVDLGGNEIEGANIVIKDKDGNEVDKWTSEEGKSHDVTVQPGTYTFKETSAPKGYVAVTEFKFTVDHLGKVTVDDAKGNTIETENGKLVVTDKYQDQKVKISKVDLGGNEIEGANIVVKDDNGDEVDKWTSKENETHEITVQPGTYTFEETSAPKGYVAVTEFKFTVDHLGNVTVDDAKGNTIKTENGKLVVTDKYQDQKVKISKVDLGGNEIEGADIVIKDKDGNEVDKWTSKENESHEVTVQPGTYTFEETNAPKGYVAVTEFKFTVDHLGNVTVDDAKGNTIKTENGKLTVTDKYEGQTVKVSKVDLGGNEIEGANIVIKDKDGNEVDKWTSEEGKSHDVTVQPGTYTFKETSAPKGYVAVTEFKFTVDHLGNVTVDDAKGNTIKTENGKLVVTDKYQDQKVKISKVDLGGNEIEGANIVVKDDNGDEVDKWTSKENETHEITVQPGTYTFEETSAPEGYVAVTEFKFTVDHLGNVTVDDAKGNTIKTENGKLTVTDQYKDQTIKVSKVDLGGNEIEGADIVIKDKDGNEVDKWTSKENETHEFTVQPGTYTFEETSAPKGYVAVTEFKFTVDHLGNVTVDDAKGNTIKTENGKLVVTDKYQDQTVQFSKQDIGGEELEGASVQLINKDGDVVDEWVSDGTVKEFSLQPGTYTFHETASPKGYEIATDITFTVDHLGNVEVDNTEVQGNTIVMVDAYSDQTVKFSKQDIGGKELKDATIQLINEDGDVVEEWVSDGTVKEFSLQPGTYTFHETASPEGYEIATDITFTVNHLGEINVEQTIVEGNTIVMVDAYSDQTVKFSKQDIGGKELKDATIQLINEDGDVVEEWVSDGNVKEFSLQPGTYTFHETASPEGYDLATDITFTVDHLGKITINQTEVKGDTVVMVDDYSHHTVKFSKQDIGGKELRNAVISLLDDQGQVIEKWVSDGNVKEFKLQPGTYTFHEVAAPEGYVIATDITFTVDLKGQITINKTKLEGNTIVMIDNYAKKPTGVKTGDDQPFMMLLSMMMMSIMAIVYLRKKEA